MINSSILFLTVTWSGIPGLENHKLGYDPQTDFDSVFVQPLKAVFPKVYKKMNLPLIYDVTFVGRKFGPETVKHIMETTSQKIERQHA